MSYAAANNFLDSFVDFQNQSGLVPWFSLNLDAWKFEGETNEGPLSHSLWMGPEEGRAVLEAFFQAPAGNRVVISVSDLTTRLNQWVQFNGDRPVRAVNREAEELHERPSLASDYVAPMTEMQASIAEIWGGLLGIKAPGIRDNFYDLGGDSLLATQMISRIREVFSVSVQIKEVFASPTIEGLSALVEGELLKRLDTLSEEEAERLIEKLQ
jgi:acyl carrier protein